MASNRYAQHLAQCLGVGTGVRRTAQEMLLLRQSMCLTSYNMRAHVKMSKRDSANGRSASPYIEDNVDEPRASKSKAKTKGWYMCFS